MINAKRGLIGLEGSSEEILADVSTIIRGVVEVMEGALGEGAAVEIVRKAVEMGFENVEDINKRAENVRREALKKIIREVLEEEK